MPKKWTDAEDPSKHLYYNGPTVFPKSILADVPNLFEHRAALCFTPTKNIPAEWVGEGPLKVRLPLAVPTIYEWEVVRGLRSPLLWLDLIQRATGKIRWKPMNPARVVVECYDSSYWGPNRIGHKGLLDAFKFYTNGRRDRRRLYYFGAIQDDGPQFLAPPFGVREFLVDVAAAAYSVVRVIPATPADVANATPFLEAPTSPPPSPAPGRSSRR